MTTSTDIVVIGGGIAGAAAAFELAAHGGVILVEAEEQPGLHATGRSAALFHQPYGGPHVQPLSRASWTVFEAPPEGFATAPLVKPRGILMIAREDQLDTLEGHVQQGSGVFTRLSTSEALSLWPALRPGHIAGAAYDASGADIDVDVLHQAFLRGARKRGAQIRLSAPVHEISHVAGGWRVLAGGEEIACGVVVNAAGAWGDEVAAAAGVEPIGLSPRRRTAALIEAPEGSPSWPMLIDADERFYLKPTSGRMLLSPAEETQVAPGEAYADDEALAEGVERMQAATILTVHQKPQAWAGLRTFTADRLPAIGADPDHAGFIWFVGQGGFGVQTAPAAAMLLAAIVTGAALPSGLIEAGVDRAIFDPARFRS